MDRVYLRDLGIETVIGVYEWERCIKQRVSLDLEMESDIRRAAVSDDLRDALNYKAVAKRVIAFVEQSRFQLVEKLAEEVARLVITEFDLAYLKLSLDKPRAVNGARGVGVIIERTAADYGQDDG
jgi:dihydroneopterin aldolase